MATSSNAPPALVDRAVWTTAFINDLPDSCFLYVAPGGKKDADGKTVPRSLRFFPYKDSSGAIDLPHLRNALARIPQSSLSPSLKTSLTAKAQKILASATNGQKAQPPKETLVRAHPGLHLRELGEKPPVMFGYLARFDEWAEIDSDFEGHFMERVAPGAFKKTITENKGRMRALFQHGQDPQIGDKPLGPIEVLEEDRQGAYYEVPLLDAPYVRETILPGLRAGLYGASFRFAVQREEFKRDTMPSDYNPKGLPERTLKELALREFGPVTFPAYDTATAGVRSLTGPMLRRELVRMDTEDLSYLGQMIDLGTSYIAEQDDPGDEVNIPKMEAVLAQLVELANYEAAETEPAGEDEDEDGRNAPPAPPTADAAPRGTSTRDAAATPSPWPETPPSIWEELWTART